MSGLEGSMKRVHIAGLLWAVFAVTGIVSAQNSPSQFVISGETARKIHDFTTINLATAKRIAETCGGWQRRKESASAEGAVRAADAPADIDPRGAIT